MRNAEKIDPVDAQMVELFANEELSDRYIWAKGLGWMKWTGKRWERTVRTEITERVRQWVLRRYKSAVASHAKAAARGDSTQMASTESEMKLWRPFTSGPKIKVITDLAYGLAQRDANEFDSDPYALNCQNGIVDLRTGELRPPDPAELVTKVTAVDYKPGATHPDWDSALQAVPDDIRPWFQLRMGQAIIGEIPEDDVMPILQGGGANGKSTILSAIQAAVADYYITVGVRALSSDPGNVPTELASLKGARLAVIEELPEKNGVDVTRLKTLVGTSTIRARYMRQDDMEFESTHTLFVTTNYPPAIVQTDDGTWRRVALVKFPYRYVKHPEDILSENDRLGDLMLRPRLRNGVEQREAVLAWLIDGARKYSCGGGEAFARIPATVEKDTEEWRESVDLILGFTKDRLEFDPDSSVLVTELYSVFNDWLREMGQVAWSNKTFSSRFGSHGIAAAHGVKSGSSRNKSKLSRSVSYAWRNDATGDVFRVWFGIRFKAQQDNVTEDPDNDSSDPWAGSAA